ncbi:MAG: hypothetical protein GMKNLPBB_02860 [Myxococcota bacterium]|nr:hypothetical protein [Myxococcota bacterium]
MAKTGDIFLQGWFDPAGGDDYKAAAIRPKGINPFASGAPEVGSP